MQQFQVAHDEVLDAMGAAVVVSDLTGVVTYWNRAAESLYGWTEAEALGRTLAELLDLPAGDSTADDVLELVSAGQTWAGEWTVLDGHGATLQIRGINAPLYDDLGTLVGIVGTAVPFATETEAREQLLASERRFRALVTYAADGIAVLDTQGVLTYASPPLARMLGEDDLDLVARPGLSFMEPADAAAIRSQIVGADVGETLGPIQLRLRHRDGSTVIVDGIRTDRTTDPDVGGIVWNLRDVSASQQAQEAIAQSEERLQALLAGSSDVTLVLDPDGQILYTGASALPVFGYLPSDLTGTSGGDLIHPDDIGSVPSIREVSTSAAADGSPVRFRVRHANGEWRWVEARYTDRTAVAAIGGLVANIRDVTDRHLADIALTESEERYRSIVETAREGIWMHDLDGNTVFANPMMATSLGTTVPKLLAQSIFDFVSPEHRAVAKAQFDLGTAGHFDTYELELCRVDGTALDVLISASPTFDSSGQVTGVLAMVTDIGDRKRAEAENVRLALEDSLTGLASRARVIDVLERMISRNERSAGSAAVLFLDLDDFKQVNDSFGHAVGDVMLCIVARRIEAAVRPGDMVGRFGGDEFVVVLDGVDEAEAFAIATRVEASLRLPLVAPHGEVIITASIGIALTPAEDASALIRDADAAMYHAKDLGGARQEFFDASLQAREAARSALEADLRQAIERQELTVHYQPVVGLDGRVVGLEALARWHHPTRGSVSPGDFIPIAEATGLIVPLGAWILDQACGELARWRRLPGHERLTLAVNLSGRQLVEPTLPGVVASILANHDLDPMALCLEMTESVLMEDTLATGAALRAIHDLGVSLAVDDFGTGYSSLLYLRRFPVDALKLDRFFVAGIDQNPRDRAIVRAVIDLAHSLNLYAVAEGVETVGQLEALADMGCDLAQGFLWSPGVPSAEMDVILNGAVLTPAGPLMALTTDSSSGDATLPADDVRPHHTVLIVDDSDAERSLLFAHLEASGWFDVVGDAADGPTAVKIAARTQPDLILLDLAMPGMDGLETLPKLLQASPGSRVAILSGFVSSGLRSQALAGGAHEVFEKGCDYGSVVKQLYGLGRAHPVPGPPNDLLVG